MCENLTDVETDESENEIVKDVVKNYKVFKHF